MFNCRKTGSIENEWLIFVRWLMMVNQRDLERARKIWESKMKKMPGVNQADLEPRSIACRYIACECVHRASNVSSQLIGPKHDSHRATSIELNRSFVSNFIVFVFFGEQSNKLRIISCIRLQQNERKDKNGQMERKKTKKEKKKVLHYKLVSQNWPVKLNSWTNGVAQFVSAKRKIGQKFRYIQNSKNKELICSLD